VNPSTAPERNERVQSVPPDASTPPIGIRVSREERRRQLLHDLANIFECAFEVKS
jgi:hypothetical protein